jgi:hypothetical protein
LYCNVEIHIIFVLLTSEQSTQKKRVILYLTLSPPTDYTKGQFFCGKAKNCPFV